MNIVRAQAREAGQVARLAIQLWTGHTLEGLTAELSEILQSLESAIYLLCEGERAVGFAQCQLRHDYVEGTETSPVGYLEGIFVEEACRGKGYARALLRACEAWAASMGCCEFASDCELDNTGSLAFHLQMGFAEANRIICFAKRI